MLVSISRKDAAVLLAAAEKEKHFLMKRKDELGVRLSRVRGKIIKNNPEESDRGINEAVRKTRAYMDYEKLSAKLGRLVTAMEHLDEESWKE